MSHRLVINKADGTIRWLGVDTGSTTLVAINRKTEQLVIRIAGHTTWVDRMTQHQYVPTRFEVHRFEIVYESDKRLDVDIPQLFGELQWNLKTKALTEI